MLTTPKTTSQNRVPYIVEVVVSERKAQQPQHCHYGRNFPLLSKHYLTFLILSKNSIQIKNKINKIKTFNQILVFALLTNK